MSTRRVLIIDSDRAFTDLVKRTLKPYGVGVEVSEDGTEGLVRAKEIGAELIFIAVDLPDKVGYALCNKAKKGVAKSLPVVLATASVPPADLEQHRKLKVHADGYLDKRTLSVAELVGQLGALIPLRAETAELSAVDMDEGEGEAFAVDAGDAVEVDAEELPFQEEELSMADALPVEEDLIPEELAVAETGVAWDGEDATRIGADVDSVIDSETEAAFDAINEAPLDEAYPDDEGATAVRPLDEIEAQGVPADDNTVSDLDLGLDAIAQRAETERAEAPLPRSARHGRREEAEPVALPEPQIDEVPVGDAPEDLSPRLAELEAEVARLHEELESAKKAAAAPTPVGGSSFSREREFLNLREVINKKEKDLIELKEQVDDKERQVLGAREQVRGLERQVREAEEKLLGLEGKLVNSSEQVAGLTTERDKGHEREKGLKMRLDIAQDEIKKFKEELESARQAAAAAAERDKEHARFVEQAASERRQAVEAVEARRVAEGAEAEARRIRELGEQAAAQAAAMQDLERVRVAEAIRYDDEKKAALAKAEERRQKDLADADNRFSVELAAIGRRHDDEKTAQAARHAETQAVLEQTRERVAALEGELIAGRESLAQRDRTVEALRGEIGTRDASLTERARIISDLERAATALKDELSRAQQKIAADESVVLRAKKAMAVALTLLDGPLPTPHESGGAAPIPGIGPGNGSRARR